MGGAGGGAQRATDDGRCRRAQRGGLERLTRSECVGEYSPRCAFVCCHAAFLFFFSLPVQSHHELKPTRDESVDLRLSVATKIKNHEFAPFCMSLTLRDKGSLVYLLFADNEAVRDVWLECFASATQVPVLSK